METAAPGIAALLEGVSEDESHAVLDLGAATAASLSVYRRFARRIRFADLPGVAASPRGRGSVAGLLEAIPSEPEGAFDLVFGWDVFDRLLPEYHRPLVGRLAEVTTATARLHVVVHGSDDDTIRPLQFKLLDTTGRMRYQPTGPAQLAHPRLLPAQVGQLLTPFRVVRGFTLKGDLREYMAVRNDE